MSVQGANSGTELQVKMAMPLLQLQQQPLHPMGLMEAQLPQQQLLLQPLRVGRAPSACTSAH